MEPKNANYLVNKGLSNAIPCQGKDHEALDGTQVDWPNSTASTLGFTSSMDR